MGKSWICHLVHSAGWASASSLHALLTRLACTRPALWAPLARLLAAHLSCARVDTPTHVTALLALLDDVADVAEAGLDDPAGDSPFCLYIICSDYDSSISLLIIKRSRYTRSYLFLYNLMRL